MLRIDSLLKSFDAQKAVDGVSFTIERGEILALIGPNGSGKTTIVKTIAGLLRPNAGTVSVEGHDVVKQPLEAKQLIGYIPDEPAVWSGMTGEEFLHFVGALYGITPKLRSERIRELLGIFALDGNEKSYFENYSRGNKQKFSILAAMLHDPKLLLVDEPIVGLDPRSAEEAATQFRKFAKAGGAILLVTHTLPVAESIADRIGVLEKGKLLALGTLRELRERAHCDASADLGKIYAALTRG